MRETPERDQVWSMSSKNEDVPKKKNELKMRNFEVELKNSLPRALIFILCLFRLVLRSFQTVYFKEDNRQGN